MFQSVGVLAMAFASMRERSPQRVVGKLGPATGAVPPLAIVATEPTMDSAVVIGILSAQRVWNVAAAVLLMRQPALPAARMAMSHRPSAP